ncbi:flagellar protein FlgN [Herbivorax sp. ANBcel31]|uniref:flagellar protein FlgN n=1 Tax=Herbivorax sp. ANBcel31 TaxID=3069754 RepID=UPI0027B0BBEC|nr:flagellar protein FlgN [Herbivorax sp. ANBcel31]MDQ2085106.1 flagellar protein FlgN [Herbivorax sp. ANBcel31]
MEYEKLNSLIDVLNEESRIYENILQISKDKTDVIIGGKVSELDEMTKLEQSFVIKIGKLEILRENCIEEISNQLNIKSSELTVSELSEHLNEENSKKLIDYKEKIGNILTELKDINDLNSRLIKNSIDYIDFSLNILSSATESNNNYGDNGEVNEEKKKTYMDLKL